MTHNAMDQAIWFCENSLYSSLEIPDLSAWPCDNTFLNSQPSGSSPIPRFDTFCSGTETLEQLGPIHEGDFEIHSENNSTSHQISMDLTESIQHRYTCAETSGGLTDGVASQESSQNPVQSIRQEHICKKRKRNSPSSNVPSRAQVSEGIYLCPYPGCSAIRFSRQGLLR